MPLLKPEGCTKPPLLPSCVRESSQPMYYINWFVQVPIRLIWW